MCRGTIHRNTNKGFDGRWLLVVWGEDPGWNPGLSEAEALAVPGRFFNWPTNKSFDPFDPSTALSTGFAQGRFGWVNEPHVKRGAKRNGGPAYVGAFCFDSESGSKYDPAHRWRG